MFNDVSDNCVTDTILSRIILTVESITEKFEGIKGELGETGRKYECILGELKRLQHEMESIKLHITSDLSIKTLELTKRIDDLETNCRKMEISFKEITDRIDDTLKIKKHKCLCTIQ
jgi:hypothetical protein